MKFESSIHDAVVRISVLCAHPRRGMISDKVTWFVQSETPLLFPAATHLRAPVRYRLPC